MNEWGWLGCWLHRREIAGWLAEEAAKRGHTLTEASAFGLLKAAIAELQKPRRGSAESLHPAGRDR
jgi:hypothetical protein